MFKISISNKNLLDGFVIIRDKISDGKGDILMPGDGTHSIM